jgi:hypothetical protein
MFEVLHDTALRSYSTLRRHPVVFWLPALVQILSGWILGGTATLSFLSLFGRSSGALGLLLVTGLISAALSFMITAGREKLLSAGVIAATAGAGDAVPEEVTPGTYLHGATGYALRVAGAQVLIGMCMLLPLAVLRLPGLSLASMLVGLGQGASQFSVLSLISLFGRMGIFLFLVLLIAYAITFVFSYWAQVMFLDGAGVFHSLSGSVEFVVRRFGYVITLWFLNAVAVGLIGGLLGQAGGELGAFASLGALVAGIIKTALLALWAIFFSLWQYHLYRYFRTGSASTTQG